MIVLANSFGKKYSFAFGNPYYISANKLYDEKQITDEKRSELKKSFDELYADYTSGKIDEQTYDKNCTELIDSCKRTDQKTE